MFCNIKRILSPEAELDYFNIKSTTNRIDRVSACSDLLQGIEMNTITMGLFARL